MIRHFTKSFVHGCAVLLSVISLSSSVAHAEQRLPKITVAYSAISAAFTPLWVAKERNLYRSNNIDVDLIYIGGGSKVMQALLSGTVQIGGLGAGVVEANIQGGGTVYLAAWVNHFVFSIYSATDLRAPQDLKGKKIGVTRFGTATEYATREALKKHGLDAGRDVVLIQTGGIPDTLAALQAGAIQAGTISPPNTLQAKKLGLFELISITGLQIPFIQSGLVATKSYIHANKQISKSLVKAIADAIKVIKEEKEFTKAVISKYTRLKDDELLEETYQVFSREFPSVPYPSTEALRFMIGLVKEVRKQEVVQPVDSFVDISFLESLVREGYFKSLSKQ
jgi:NitT/TauT family transport system substrate-binding protein